MILEVVMEMVIPLMMASIIDKGVEVGDMPYKHTKNHLICIL